MLGCGWGHVPTHIHTHTHTAKTVTKAKDREGKHSETHISTLPLFHLSIRASVGLIESSVSVLFTYRCVLHYIYVCRTAHPLRQVSVAREFSWQYFYHPGGGSISLLSLLSLKQKQLGNESWKKVCCSSVQHLFFAVHFLPLIHCVSFQVRGIQAGVRIWG